MKLILAAFSRSIQPNVSKISAFDGTENIKGTQYEYSQNSIEMLKFLSFTVYFLHFDDFFNQMILKFSAFNKTVKINGTQFKLFQNSLKMFENDWLEFYSLLVAFSRVFKPNISKFFSIQQDIEHIG